MQARRLRRPRRRRSKMANYKQIIPFILSWEGGFCNRKNDRGGATNKGVTINTWRGYCAKKGKPATIETLKAMTTSEWEEIFKTMYWDALRLDKVTDQNVANIMVDWAWASGVGTAARQLQKLVGVKVDGIIGNKTLAAVNSTSGLPLFGRIKQMRLLFVKSIAKNDKSQQENLRGWERRINSIMYDNLILNK